VTTILIFGDSNTHGTPPMASLDEAARFPPSVRWPNVMATELGPDFTVIAEGHPGRTSVFDDPVEGRNRNGSRILPVLLESHAPIALVAIMLGTNDLKARFCVPALDIALGCGRLASLARQSATGPAGSAPDVMLICPPPIHETGCLAEMFRGGANASNALPARLRDIANELGAGFFDAGDACAVDPLDGIHLNEGATLSLGRAAAGAVRERLGQSMEDMGCSRE